ncbi:FAD/NAD(P)-binding protein [Streptomyces sp. NPDC088554]|uniref:FAD/NAD(P)-binding protein n=1 Tax=Streptomyces sp. NPDC088554 TaxID=3365865 RepID=UPI0037F227D9
MIGAGASGTLTAVHLLEGAEHDSLPLDVWLIDPAEADSRGPAYDTDDPRHLLNVPVGRMSAFPGDPGHFVHWLSARGDGPVDPGEYVSRFRFRAYLSDILDSVSRRGTTALLHRLRDRVTGVDSAAEPMVLALRSGRSLPVDAVVLALGNVGSECTWAPPSLRASHRFVPDPWRPGALSAVPPGADVLIVGTGLTMVDVAVSLGARGRVVHAVSRRGMVPNAHRRHPGAAIRSPQLSGAAGLADLRRAVLRHIARSRRLHGDWRTGMDGLRSLTSTLWQQLPVPDRSRFLAEDLRLWDVHRHRMAPATAAALDAALDAGSVTISTDEISEAVALPDGLRIRLASGRSLDVGAVVNCAGPPAAPAEADDPLLQGLLGSGTGRQDAVGVGLDTREDGRLCTSRREGLPRIWTLGALRRGTLLESTAIPEIRQQAEDVARSVLCAVRKKRGTGRPKDRYGLPLTTNAKAAAAYNEALDRILRVQSGAAPFLREALAADPRFAVGHAALALLGHAGVGCIDTPGELRAAQTAASTHADHREAAFVASVTARLTGTPEAGAATLLRYVDTYPRDALAVSTALPTISSDGVTTGREAWDLVEGLTRVYGTDDWWFLGQLAFVRQEQERWEEAESLSVRALRQDPSAGHAVHARTHVFYETGAHQEGLVWLDEWLRKYGPHTDQPSHFSWHAALHELMLDKPQAVSHRYGTQLAPPRVTGPRALVDSMSLLWRCRVVGSWPESLPVRPVTDVAPVEWLRRPPTAFAALHGALSLAAASERGLLLELGRHAHAHPRAVFREVIAPLCDALTAVVESRWLDAITVLRQTLPYLDRVGGSLAQREVIEETLLFALIAGGCSDDAADLLSRRLDRRPARLDQRRLHEVRAGSVSRAAARKDRS